MAALAELVPRLLERHRVRAGIARFQPRKRAEQTACDAHIGRFEADVVVVEGAAGVPLLAFPIRQPADQQQIGCLEQPDSVVQIQPDSGRKFLFDVRKAGGAEAWQHRSI
jgi:hypothetical protein